MSNKYTYSVPFSRDELFEAYVTQGMSQHEVAVKFGTTQKVVWRALHKFGIPVRKAIKRDQRGEKNSTWKGSAACYTAFHARVTAAKGQPKRCDVCGTDDPSRRYDWANLTGDYADIDDYKRMCRSCHRQYDRKRRNFKGAVGGRPAPMEVQHA